MVTMMSETSEKIGNALIGFWTFSKWLLLTTVFTVGAYATISVIKDDLMFHPFATFLGMEAVWLLLSVMYFFLRNAFKLALYTVIAAGSIFLFAMHYISIWWPLAISFVLVVYALFSLSSPSNEESVFEDALEDKTISDNSDNELSDGSDATVSTHQAGTTEN